MATTSKSAIIDSFYANKLPYAFHVKRRNFLEARMHRSRLSEAIFSSHPYDEMIPQAIERA
jgi:hypothetical protein